MCSPALGLEPQHETGVGFRSVGGRAGRGGGTSQPRPLKRGAHVLNCKEWPRSLGHYRKNGPRVGAWHPHAGAIGAEDSHILAEQ